MTTTIPETIYLYFHGLPGFTGEIGLFSSELKSKNFIAINRLKLQSTCDSYDDYLIKQAEQIKQDWPTQNIHLVGFSLGTMTCLRLAKTLEDKVTGLDLTSVAAPLELGDFLAHMVGRPVFDAAKSSKFKFNIFCMFQAVMVRTAPNLFFKMLFSSANGEDKPLAAMDSFKSTIALGLRHSLLQYLLAYKREVHAYVNPWADKIEGLDVNITFWHGVEDNWSPIEMANFLVKNIGKKCNIVTLEGKSHYSTLQTALEEIEKSSQKI